MNHSYLTHSILKIIDASFNRFREELQLTVEIVQGELPQAGDYIYLKEKTYSVHAYPIVSIKKPMFKRNYSVKIYFFSSEYLWKDIQEYWRETGDKNVYCGISPDKYDSLNIATKKQYIQSMIDLLGAGRLKGFLKDNMDTALKLIRKRVDKNTTGLSKIGGLPDLPPDLEFPKDENGTSCLFAGQIHLAEFKEYFQPARAIDANGIIYFFASIDLDDEDYPAFGDLCVRYSDSTENLSKKELPEDLDSWGIFKEYDLYVVEEINLPSQDLTKLMLGEISEEENDTYDHIHCIMLELNHHYTGKLFGYPEPVQTCVFMEAELAEKKLLWYGKAPYKDEDVEAVFRKLAPEISQWKLLYQFNAYEFDKLSGYKKEFNRYNEGTYYVVIKQSDLNEKRFHKAVTIYQTT